MDSLLEKRTVPVARVLLDMHQEYVLSGDFVLPDYCPDVAVVLKCTVTPRIHSRQWNGDQLLLDGMATVRVLYLDEERQCVRAADFSQPIACSFAAGAGLEQPAVFLEVTPDYVSCRAIGPRRLEVRGSLQIHGRADGRGELELAQADETEKLHIRSTEEALLIPGKTAEKTLSVDETVELEPGQPEAERLLSCDCRATVLEYKLLSEKAIVKGQLCCHVLYAPVDTPQAIEAADFLLPFSQILDLEGAQEGLSCVADVSVLSDRQRITVNAEGKSRGIELNVKLLVQCQLYQPVTVPLLLDAYRTDCPVETESREITLESLCGAVNRTVTVQKNLPLPDGEPEKILDAWVWPGALEGEAANGTATLTGSMTVAMLTVDREGFVAYYEKPETFSVDCALDGERVTGKAQTMSVSYGVVSGQLELRIGMALQLRCGRTRRQAVLERLIAKTEQSYPPEKACLKLYYAQAGESVWNIARHCHTAPTEICRENALNGDSLTEPTVLVVPLR